MSVNGHADEHGRKQCEDKRLNRDDDDRLQQRDADRKRQRDDAHAKADDRLLVVSAMMKIIDRIARIAM